LASNFVKYQEDLASILANEFVRLTQKLQSHESRFRDKMHDSKCEAVSLAREQIMAEIKAEWGPLRDMVAISGESTCRSFSVKWSSRETAGTSNAREEPGMDRELLGLMQSTRKDIDMVHGDLRAHITATERRLADLERGGGAQQKIRAHINATERRLAELEISGGAQQKKEREVSHSERIGEFFGGLMLDVQSAIGSPHAPSVSQAQPLHSPGPVQSPGLQSRALEEEHVKKMVSSPKVTELCRLFEASAKVDTRDTSSKLNQIRGRKFAKTAPGSIAAPSGSDRSLSATRDGIAFDPFPQKGSDHDSSRSGSKTAPARSFSPNDHGSGGAPSFERNLSARHLDIQPERTSPYQVRSSSLSNHPNVRIRRTLPGRFQLREVPPSPSLELRTVSMPTGYAVQL